MVAGLVAVLISPTENAARPHRQIVFAIAQ
jgi:hypothetical protein